MKYKFIISKITQVLKKTNMKKEKKNEILMQVILNMESLMIYVVVAGSHAKIYIFIRIHTISVRKCTLCLVNADILEEEMRNL